jgi:hypothetical protein
MQHVEERVYDFKCQEEILLALKRLSTLIGEENVNLDPQFEAMHEFRVCTITKLRLICRKITFPGFRLI